MMSRLALCCALAAMPMTASAQDGSPPPPQPGGPTTPVQSAATSTTAPAAATPAAAAPCCLIASGTMVEIAIDEPIDSKTAVIGQHFAIHLTTPLQLSDGNFVIAAGTHGVGEVIHAAKAHMGGKAGELILSARYLEVGGVQVPLRGFHIGGQGKDNTGLVSAATMSFGLAGMLISGGEKRVPVGSIATAKIAVDTTLPPLPQPTVATTLPAASTTQAVGASPAAIVPAAITRESQK
jgi:hypothetical protein